MIPIAIEINIAAIILIGKSVNHLLNKSSEITRTLIAAIPCDRFDVAQLLMLSAVLTSTAVAGNPPISPDPMFAIAFPRISLSLLNQTFVIFSPIFPEIIVSKMVIIAIIAEVWIIAMRMLLSPIIFEKLPR